MSAPHEVFVTVDVEDCFAYEVHDTAAQAEELLGFNRADDSGGCYQTDMVVRYLRADLTCGECKHISPSLESAPKYLWTCLRPECSLQDEEETMGNLRSHAERELRAQGYNLEQTEEDPNKWMCQSVLELIDLFAAQGHSGFSAPHCVAIFTKLARFEPLGPLNGTPDEWMEIGTGVEQNVRCGRVFRENGQAYDSNGKVFRDPDGCTYTNRDSRVPVEFPYTPKTEVVDRFAF